MYLFKAMFCGPTSQVEILKIGAPDLPLFMEKLGIMSSPSGCVCTQGGFMVRLSQPVTILTWIFFLHPMHRSHSASV